MARLAILILSLGVAASAEAACPNYDSGDAGATSTSGLRFVTNDDGTVSDIMTGLMWKRCLQGRSGSDCASGAAGEFRWVEALNEARGESFAGFDDWRLPKVEELCSIVVEGVGEPTIDATLFPNAHSAKVWSASASLDFATDAWAVDFANGEAVVGDRSDAEPVRLVRSGQ